MKAYWFSKQDGTTGYQTNPVEVGRTDVVEGEIVPCRNGLHASPTPFDALCYAMGSLLWVVEIDDDAVPHGEPVDKYASKSRTYLQKLDCEHLMRTFAAREALSVLPYYAPEVVKEYLTDEANGIDRSDIRPAARDAAWSTAQSAARSAAWSAAWSTAQSAARSAAWSIAQSAARDAAWNAVRDAAWDAAWSAARSAARDAVKERFNKMVEEALKGA